jgi:hypothetical protein
MRTKREPWYRTLAKLMVCAAVLYFLGAAVLFYAATQTDSLLYWATGALLSIGGGIILRTAWDIRK